MGSLARLDFGGIIFTELMQRKELILQRKELELSGEEMKKQAEALQ